MAGLLTPWAVSLPVLLAPMFGVWVVSVVTRDTAVVDVFWGPGFGIVAGYFAWALPPLGLRGQLVLGAVLLWALRLGLHLGVRWWGKDEEDYRYAAMRAEHGAAWTIRSLFTVFGLQALLIWLLSPVILLGMAAGGAPGPLGWTGAALFAVGFLWEAVADLQLTRFKADPGSRGEVLDSGLWRYSRHPNYFGEAVLWWGIGLLAADAGALWTLYAPAFITALLLKVSGVPLLEGRLKETRPEYADYARRTSSFVPWPPKTP